MKSQHAITVIGFRRPAHMYDTLSALLHNHGMKNAPLYIFIDGPRGTKQERALEHEQTAQTRAVCEAFSWPGKKIIHAAKTNKGLQQNVRYAIDTTLTDYTQAVIVEDDIITSPYFYGFVTSALERFEEHEEVAAVCAHCYPFDRTVFNPASPYFLRHFACWGWATWRRSWDNVCWDTAVLKTMLKQSNSVRQLDFGRSRWVSGTLEAQDNGYINTWDVQTGVSFFLNGQLCLYPPETLTNNTGWRSDGTSTHVVTAANPNAPLAYIDFPISQKMPVTENSQARTAYQKLVYRPLISQLKRCVCAAVKLPNRLMKRLKRKQNKK